LRQGKRARKVKGFRPEWTSRFVYRGRDVVSIGRR
jgi:hypothetical protein